MTFLFGMGDTSHELCFGIEDTSNDFFIGLKDTRDGFLFGLGGYENGKEIQRKRGLQMGWDLGTGVFGTAGCTAFGMQGMDNA